MEKILDDSTVQQVREIFEKLKEPVQLLYFEGSENCETCEATRQLLEEIVALHDKLGLEVHDLQGEAALAAQYRVSRAPAIVIAAREDGQIRDLGIQFSGIPAGHEFSTLINDILLVSQRDSGLSQKAREFLKKLDQPLLLQVFVTPT